MRFDTEKQGLETVFEPWQVKVVELICSLQPGEYVGTKDTHLLLLDGGVTVSRASVINFLEYLNKEGLVTSKQESGKGGYHSLYTAKHDLAGLVEEISSKLVEAITVELSNQYA